MSGKKICIHICGDCPYFAAKPVGQNGRYVHVCIKTGTRLERTETPPDNCPLADDAEG